MTAHRTELVALSDRLIQEYDGLLPAGQVIRSVCRAHRVVRRLAVPEPSRSSACEDVARRLLRQRLGTALG